MSRHIHFFRCTLLLVFILSSCTEVPDKKIEIKPLRNVVDIVGDDHANYTLGSYGNDMIQTPNLDKFADQGVRFVNAYANAPMCSASRQSVQTGQYPHASGVTLLFTSFSEEKITIADHLNQFGFKSAIIGKNHFNNGLNHGYDEKIDRRDYFKFLEENPPREVPDSIKVRPKWKPFRDHSRIWLNAEARPGDKYDADDIGTFYASKAVDFINENKDDRLLLWLGFHEPHSPFNFPVEYGNTFNPDDVPFPTGGQEDDEFIPLVFKDLTEEERKGIISAYYTSVKYLDKNIGMVLDGIKEAGLEDSTLVIYFGDHGYLLNHHKRFEKHMMWEEAVSAPLIIRAGNQKPVRMNHENLVEFVDIAPTIMDILNVPVMENQHGKSLKSFFIDKEVNHKEYVFSEFLADNKAMIKSDKWKYIFTSGKRDLQQGYETGNPRTGIRHRLYDQRNDPEETTDISGLDENQEIVKKMKDEMIKLFKETHPKADSLPEGLSKDEQLEWFCEPPEGNKGIDGK